MEPIITPGKIASLGLKAANHTGFAGNSGAKETREENKIKNALTGSLYNIKESLNEEDIKHFGKDAARRIRKKLKSDGFEDTPMVKFDEFMKKPVLREAESEEEKSSTSKDGKVVINGMVLNIPVVSLEEADEFFIKVCENIKARPEKDPDRIWLEEKMETARERCNVFLRKHPEFKNKETVRKNLFPWFLSGDIISGVLNEGPAASRVNPFLFFTAAQFYSAMEGENVGVANLSPRVEKETKTNPSLNQMGDLYGKGNPYMDNPLMNAAIFSSPGMSGSANAPTSLYMPQAAGDCMQAKWMQWMPYLMMFNMVLNPLMGILVQGMFMGGMI